MVVRPSALRQRPATLVAVLALAAACAGCGGDEPPTPRAALPPTWRAVRDEVRPDSVLVDVQAGEPCRLRLRVIGPMDEVLEDIESPLTAGEVRRVWARWSGALAAEGSLAVSPDDAAAGRTEGWLLNGWLGHDQASAGGRARHVAARPGRARLLGPWIIAAPGAATAIAYGRDVDLLAFALVDGAAGVELVGRENGSRLSGRVDAGAGDRAHLVRFVMRLERAAP